MDNERIRVAVRCLALARLFNFLASMPCALPYSGPIAVLLQV
jgi:hypothetical protein